METTAACAAAARGGVSLPISSSSQSSRKEWRIVSEQLVRSAANEDLERSKLGQSEERLIYEVQHGSDPVNVDFCAMAIDRVLDNNILQQRLQSVAKQRDELQLMEIELRGQLNARSKIVDMQSAFEAQIQEQVGANIKLQEQLHEMEQKMHELERKMDDKEQELHAVRLDNEAAWAKDDLLREQNKELQSYRRERDNSEAERIQHIKQIHDLNEHIQDKERQFMEMQEQKRIAQETIVFKDEQLRDAQAWITRAREVDVIQSTTNQTLQAELRERTEHCNQLWLGCQRQFGEMERLHLHVQQLLLELADVRERSGSQSDGSQVSLTNSKDAGQLGLSNGRPQEGTPGGNSGNMQNGNSENPVSLTSGGNTEKEHVHGVLFSPPSLLGMPTYPPPGQMAALHPFIIHQQGLPYSMNSQVTQSHFVPLPASSTDHPALSDDHHALAHQYQQTQENLIGTNSHYEYETSGNGQVNNISCELDTVTVVPSPNDETQVLNSVDKSYNCAQSQQNLQQISFQFHDFLNLDPLGHENETEEKNVKSAIDNVMENKNMMMETSNPAMNAIPSEGPNTISRTLITNGNVPSFQKTDVVGKAEESPLLDERSVLACIVRTIGSGGRIRISSTLPNRLGKMLAPLHWHDYKKQYGKLEDFMASHPELFVIEEDYIQLREGAQETIAATAAVAKVAAAASAPSSYPAFLPSVTVTPMAQSHRLKRISSFETSSENVAPRRSSLADNQNLNGISLHVGGGGSSVKILRKLKDPVEVNDSEARAGGSVPVENGAKTDKKDFSQSRAVSQGKARTSSVAKHQSRSVGVASSSLRR